MAARKVLAGFAVLVLGAGITASVATAFSPCGYRACSDEIAASGLSGQARGACLRQVIADCRAGLCSCTAGSPPCSCVCGDGQCGPSEDCSTCPQDCGTCPTTTTTTTTTQAQVQCCGSPGGAFDGECVVEATCDANHPQNFGPGGCSPNPCATTTTTTTTLPCSICFVTVIDQCLGPCSGPFDCGAGIGLNEFCLSLTELQGFGLCLGNSAFPLCPPEACECPATTTTTLPCNVLGAPCGTCGTGTCKENCGPVGPTLVCTAQDTGLQCSSSAFICGQTPSAPVCASTMENACPTNAFCHPPCG